jgi:hypothetical protein
VSDPFRPANKGEQVLPRLNAGWFNGVNRAVNASRGGDIDLAQQKQARASRDAKSVTVDLINRSGSDIARPGGVLKLNSAAFAFADRPKQVFDTPVLEGVTPTNDDDDFVILKKPLKNGQPGEGVRFGFAVCRLNYTDEAKQHTNARPESGNVNYLTSAGSGVPIVWRELEDENGEDTTGEQWAIVRLGDRPQIIHGTGSCTLNQQAFSISTPDGLIWIHNTDHQKFDQQTIAAVPIAPVEVEVAPGQVEPVSWRAISSMDRHVRIGVVTTAASGSRSFNECDLFARSGGVATVGGWPRDAGDYVDNTFDHLEFCQSFDVGYGDLQNGHQPGDVILLIGNVPIVPGVSHGTNGAQIWGLKFQNSVNIDSETGEPTTSPDIPLWVFDYPDSPPPGTGEITDGCGILVASNEVSVVVSELVGLGLREDPNNGGVFCAIAIDPTALTGCGLEVASDNADAAVKIKVDPDALAGRGIEADPANAGDSDGPCELRLEDPGETYSIAAGLGQIHGHVNGTFQYQTLTQWMSDDSTVINFNGAAEQIYGHDAAGNPQWLGVGCGLEIDSDELRLDRTDLAGIALKAGTGTCDLDVAVDNCTLIVNLDNELQVDLTTIAGYGLDADISSGNCTLLVDRVTLANDMADNTTITANLGVLSSAFSAGCGINATSLASGTIEVAVGCGLACTGTDVFVDANDLAGLGLTPSGATDCELDVLIDECSLEFGVSDEVKVKLASTGYLECNDGLEVDRVTLADDLADNITITASGGVLSAVGGGGGTTYTAGCGIDLTSDVISVDVDDCTLQCTSGVVSVNLPNITGWGLEHNLSGACEIHVDDNGLTPGDDQLFGHPTTGGAPVVEWKSVADWLKTLPGWTGSGTQILGAEDGTVKWLGTNTECESE